MAAIDQKIKQLERAQRDLNERLDDFVPRLAGAENIAAQHGDRHTDLNEDPILAELMTGHTHPAGSTPVVESVATSTGSTVTLPSGIVSGDFLVVVTTKSGAGGVGWPAGWSSAFVQQGGNTITLNIGVREADGTEGATISVTSAGASTAYRISGARVASTAVSYEVSTGVFGVSTDPDPDELVTSGGNKNYLWIAFAGMKDDGGEEITAAPTNYTNLLAIKTGTTVVGSAQRSLNAVSEDPGGFTSISGGWAAGTIAIYPDEANISVPAEHRPPYDIAIAPGENLAQAFDNGAKSVFVLNGAHTLAGGFTVPGDGHLWGQTRDGVVITTGAYTITDLGKMENLTLDEGTAQPTIDLQGGTLRDVTAQNMVRHIDITGTFSTIDTVDLLAFDGGSSDAPIIISGAGANTIVNTFVNTINDGDATGANRACIEFTAGNTYNKISNCITIKVSSNIYTSSTHINSYSYLVSGLFFRQLNHLWLKHHPIK